MEIQQKKVLVAESNELVLVLISHVLTRSSYVVHQCMDAAKAEELLATEVYDAALVDLRMPDGGAPLLKRALQRNPALQKKLILLVGAAEDALAVDGVPVCAIVRKPVEVYELLETVRRCIDGTW